MNTTDQWAAAFLTATTRHAVTDWDTVLVTLLGSVASQAADDAELAAAVRGLLAARAEASEAVADRLAQTVALVLADREAGEVS